MSGPYRLIRRSRWCGLETLVGVVNRKGLTNAAGCGSYVTQDARDPLDGQRIPAKASPGFPGKALAAARASLVRSDNSLTPARACSIFVLIDRNRGERVSDPISDPNICADRSPASRDGIGSVRSAPAKAERERRVVEGLKGGVSMAEIARREGISERGLRKYVRTLFARRAPEATGEFIATQMSRLNEALRVSFGAMSAENLPAVDRVVKSCANSTAIRAFAAARAALRRAASSWKASFPEPKRTPLSWTDRIRAIRCRTSCPIRPPFPPIVFGKSLPRAHASPARVGRTGSARNRNAPQPAGNARFGSRDAARPRGLDRRGYEGDFRPDRRSDKISRPPRSATREAGRRRNRSASQPAGKSRFASRDGASPLP